MKRIASLDILKYIACFFVINIHMDIPTYLLNIIQPLLTTAVPVFFMITGFFYESVVESGSEKRQLKKIAILTLVANLIHILWCCFKLIINRKSILILLTEVLNLEALLNLFVFNQPIWRTSIWYINALLIVLVLIYIVRKWVDPQKLYLLIPVLLVLNLVLGTYSFILPGNEHILLCYSRNFLLCGIPYFLLGNYVSSKKQSICKLFGKWQCVVLFWIVGCFELWILNYFGLLQHNDHLASSFFLALSLFCVFAKNNSFVGKFSEKISIWGRKYSFAIYVAHSIIIEIFYKIVYKASVVPFVIDIFSYIGPILVLIASTFFAHSLFYCKDKLMLSKNA